MWKAFIEMKSIQEAQISQNKLDNVNLFDDGSKMNVYHSTMKYLKFQNNNSGGVDYTLLKNQQTNTSFKNTYQPFQPQFSEFGSPFQDQGQFNYDNCSTNMNTPQLYNNYLYDQNDQNLSFNLFKTPQGNFRNDNNLQQVQSEPVNTFKKLNMQEKEKYTKILNISSLPKNSENTYHNQLIGGNNQNINNQEENQSSNNIQYCKNEVLENQQNQLQKEQKENTNKNLKNNQFSPKKINKFQDIEKEDSEIKKQENSQLDSQQLTKDLQQISIQNQKESGQNNKNQDNNREEIGNLLNLQQKQEEDDILQSAFKSKEHQKQNILDHINNNYSLDLNNKLETSVEQIYDLIQKKKNQPSLDLAQYVNPLFVQENQKSKVVYIRGIEYQQLYVNNIYNLFSNYGNIETIIYLRTKKSCLIEYQTVEYATNAKDFLNGKLFQGSTIRIFYSNYETIKLKNNDPQYQSEDIFLGSIDTYRFKPGKQMSLNPPSQTLHISNLKKEGCNQNQITKLFSRYGRVEGLKFIFQQNKNMCLVKMGTVEEAITAITFMHRFLYLGRNMQISFTHSKIY